MIYYVTNQKELFDNVYTLLSIEESLQLLDSCEILQYDSETDGRDPHINRILCIQLGNKAKDFQMVIDVSTVDILLYKNILESKFIVGQNLKFDLQFLYNYNIIPRKVYDTMIVEQFLYLGFPPNLIGLSSEQAVQYNKIIHSFSDWDSFNSDTKKDIFFSKNAELADIVYNHTGVGLKALCWRYLKLNIDKTVRGQIRWRGLDTEVILYAAKDVEPLEDIMWKQLEICKQRNCIKGAKLECDSVPFVSYLEWCGVYLDSNSWNSKMKNDTINLSKAKKSLDEFIINSNNPKFKKYIFVNDTYDLFEEVDFSPQCNINWSSSKQVIEVAKILGFNTKVIDKKTGEDKDSVLEKQLKTQKGINDEFLKLYFDYQEYAKVVSSFGQTHLDSVNPITHRLHTQFKQLGASSGRMSCGSSQNNEDLARYKGLQSKQCKYVNLQQLPADKPTRSSFKAMNGNLFISCDFSAEELTNLSYTY